MRDSEEQDMDEQATTTPSPAPPTPAAVVAAADATRSTTPRPQPARILGRNVNGTVVQTSMPQNEAELQLYRVMQRASLLSYYDTLLEMGGDDVQQLCDAGEEEFLEIMALVGMASKPLHVRRLQKALQEWLTNPGMFQTPVLAPPSSSSSCSTASSSTSTAAAATAVPGKKAATPTAPAAATAVPVVAAPVSAFPGIPPGSYSPKQPSAELLLASSSGISALSSIGSQTAKLAAATASTPSAVICPSSALTQPAQLVGSSYTPAGCGGLVQRRKSLSPIPFGVTGIMPMQQQPPVQPAGVVAEPSASALPSTLPMSHSPGILQSMNYESSSCGSQGTTPSPGSNCAINAPQSPTAVNVLQMTTPILLESQVQRLAELSERIAAKYRPVNPKPPTGIKKKISKNLETIMAMPDSDPRKMEEIRKYAAIYGRFDCKRKPEKPLTLHEVSVNEAAAQICRFAPILLTRRDELFPLARQVVRHSGHYFNKTYVHTSCMTSPPRRLSSSRENGDGDLSGGDESLLLPGQDLAKKRKLELRCTSEDDSVTGNGDNPSEQTETARLRCVDFSRTSSLGVDSDGIPIQIHQNRHRKRQRRRSRPLKIGHKSTSSPIWQSCSDGSGNIMDGVVDGLEDSDGCYSSFEDDWDDCNGDGCEDNFGIDSEDEDDNEDETASGNTALINDSQMRANLEEDEASCMMDKENDFNLKVIASCGDNIIAVANPALMSRNQPAAIAKEQNIKEEIALRDRRD